MYHYNKLNLFVRMGEREALVTHLGSKALCFNETTIHRTFDCIHVALKVSKKSSLLSCQKTILTHLLIKGVQGRLHVSPQID